MAVSLFCELIEGLLTWCETMDGCLLCEVVTVVLLTNRTISSCDATTSMSSMNLPSVTPMLDVRSEQVLARCNWDGSRKGLYEAEV